MQLTSLVQIAEPFVKKTWWYGWYESPRKIYPWEHSRASFVLILGRCFFDFDHTHFDQTFRFSGCCLFFFVFRIAMLKKTWVKKPKRFFVHLHRGWKLKNSSKFEPPIHLHSWLLGCSIPSRSWIWGVWWIHIWIQVASKDLEHNLLGMFGLSWMQWGQLGSAVSCLEHEIFSKGGRPLKRKKRNRPSLKLT